MSPLNQFRQQQLEQHKLARRLDEVLVLLRLWESEVLEIIMREIRMLADLPELHTVRQRKLPPG